MRRVVLLLALAATLASAATAAAAFQPIRRAHGEYELPRVRAGTIVVPAGHGRGRLRVIVTLRLPPLAAFGRTLAARAARERLDVRSRASRAYLARIERAQRAAVAELRRAIPSATVSRRFRVVLDGLTVELPARELPRLARLSFAARVYPSFRYTLQTNRSPALIGADRLAELRGARGEGVKIGVVDDGIDPANPFFDPAGYSYPPGFPKGGVKWTTPKVIVARAFPGPGSGRRGRLALDPRASFHGTHVAGIAAGDAGTNAPAGPDHPAVAGLHGVAPRAWLGNYRVFNVPTPIGHVANTPEIVAAFEAAVVDGMDVINFSGGGPQVDPVNDAMTETVRNVALAGVVPVIAAGNDRDQYGLGSAGSPGTAPDAISVAAVSNDHVFAPSLSVLAPDAPASLRSIPFVPAVREPPPAELGSGWPLVDVGSIVGTDGAPVPRLLCGPAGDPNRPVSTLPAGSLSGAIALVSRGACTFASKAARAKAAGAVAIVFVDNRSGEANDIPVRLELPSGMIADADGAALRGWLAAHDGRTTVRIGRDPLEIETGRGGVVTSFSSAGPTAFGHELKPDVAAPGGQILSATLPAAGGPFAVFDGTSMATPHVAGAAALLVERHPGWTARQVKSALVSTAGPAWGDTSRTAEAPVLLGGSGLVDVLAADDPRVFTDPTSLSFGDVDVSHGPVRKGLLLALADADGGAGTWQIEVHPQAQPAGVGIDVPSSVPLAPFGDAFVPVAVSADARSATGDAYGFLLLRNGPVVRKVPYAFLVTRPRLADAPVRRLRLVQQGDTRKGVSRVEVYRYPAAPWGPAPDYAGAPVREDGAETVYDVRVNEPVANVGAAVIAESPGALVHPWLLGSLDENDVQGYAGTPVNVNPLTLDYPLDIGAAAAVFPRQKRFFVVVDSGRDAFTGRSLAGKYVLRAWINDVSPPLLGLITDTVSAGRPTIALRSVDFGAGVDPYSLAIGYGRVLVGAAAYDPVSGIALFPLPAQAPALKPGKLRLAAASSDFQEAKNVDSVGEDIMPNTAFASGPLKVVDGPTVAWLAPEQGQCLDADTPLAAVGGSTARVRSVRFLDGERLVATVRSGRSGLYTATWRSRRAAKGEHELAVVLTDAKGRTARETRKVTIAASCR